MSRQDTINKLSEMRLSTMANEYQLQIDNPKMKEQEFDDRLAMMVDAEYSKRRTNSIIRKIHTAGFDQPDASIEDINYECGRKINKNTIKRIASCEFIDEKRHIFITGATGSGITYLSNAIGVEACKRFYTVLYVRTPDLLIDLEIARDEETYKKVLNKYAKPQLLILDEWLLVKPSAEEKRDIFELLHRRSKNNRSIIFCSQFRRDEWYDQFGGADAPLTDAIMDRIVHNGYDIDIKSSDPNKDISMREYYASQEAVSEAVSDNND